MPDDEKSLAATTTIALSRTTEMAAVETLEPLLGLSKEDWLIIDEALHRVARSLRKIEQEEKRKQLQAAAGQTSANQ